MEKFKSSIDIILSTETPEQQEPVTVVPITATESLVASRGLAKHIDVLYKGVVKKSNPDRALLQVFNFISDDVTKFRKQSRDIAVILNPDGPEIDMSRASAGLALSALIRGQRSHTTGVWLKGKAAERQATDIFKELNDINSLDFFELRKQGYAQSINNGIYWLQQLKTLRGNDYIERIRRAIDESDHYTE